MDRKELALFFIISAAILTVWWLIVTPLLLGPRTAAAPQAPSTPEIVVAGESAGQPLEPGLPAGAVQEQATEIEPLADIELKNDLIQTLWTNRGASLQSLTLLSERYRAPYKIDGGRPPLTLLRDFQERYCPDTVESVVFHIPQGEGLTRRSLQVPLSNRLYRVVEKTADRLVFETHVADGAGHSMRVQKTVTMPPGKYWYEVTLEFLNTSSEPYEFSYVLRGPAGIERETLDARHVGTRVGTGRPPGPYKVRRTSSMALRKGAETVESAGICWAAVVNHYFVAVTYLSSPDRIESVTSQLVTDTDLAMARGRWGPGTVRRDSDRQTLAERNAAVVLQMAPLPLEPHRTVPESYRCIAAPKLDKLLATCDPGLIVLVEYGWLPSVSRVAMAILNGAYALIPNYGVAILVLTALVRLVLHPLTRKSQLSMVRMQKLQPQLEELQRKYANDRQKLVQEQMELFRRYGVSPLSGCWPMALQMPILFALYGALAAAIELRHARFLWVSDLSQPDTIVRLPVYLPFLWDEVNLLPILMAAAMFLNQKLMTPPPTTQQAAQQQKIFKWMPIAFALLFYHMPSGLCLYWTASTAIGICEKWAIDRKAATIGLEPVGSGQPRARRPSAEPQGESTWLDRLREWVEAHAGNKPNTRRGKKS